LVARIGGVPATSTSSSVGGSCMTSPGVSSARGLLPADHDMREPGREPMAGIVAHRALLGRGAERVGDALGGPLVVRREGDADMAIVEDGVVLAIGLLDLVEALRDQEGAHAIAGEEGEAGLEEVEAAERRELVEHHQQLVPARARRRVQMLGQPAADLVEHEADQRLGAADVRGRHDQVERDRCLALDQVGDPPVARDGDRRRRSDRGRGRGTTSRSTARPSVRSRTC
jgi:hypothetical protein